MSDENEPPRPDRDLGESRPIPRRDFLQGALVGAATALTGPLLKAYAADVGAAAQDRPGYYPPQLTGMRGSHPGAFESAHALRDGTKPEAGTDSGEVYDLVVVGGGISGLSAAHFYRAQTSGRARILILDNHDDFGGHAKRNEFQIAGRTLLMNGGTLEIDSPRPYDAAAAGLIKELGIDVAALRKKVEQRDFYRGLGMQPGYFFDQETFGADKLVVGAGVVPAAKLLADAPLSAAARADFVRLIEGNVDYLPGLSSAEKKLRLSKLSYRDFLRDLVKVRSRRARLLSTQVAWGVGGRHRCRVGARCLVVRLSGLPGHEARAGGPFPTWATRLPVTPARAVPKRCIFRMATRPSRASWCGA